MRSSTFERCFRGRAASRRALLAVAAACALSSAQAFVITGVSAPDLVRPNDGVLYPFTITISGVYDALDQLRPGVNIRFSGEYWDADVIADDPIDLTGTALIAGIGLAGKPWVTTMDFDVGCKVNPEVFGPSGATGEAPMDDGYFSFTDSLRTSKWGYNTVTCGASTAGSTTDKPRNRVPEPSVSALLGLAALSAVLLRPRRRRD